MNAPVKTPPVTFAEAFIALQFAIKPAIKDAENEAFKRGGKASRYADLGAVWEAIKAPLKDNNFAVIQMPQFEGETMYLETILLHVSGEKISGRYPLRPAKQDPQGFGSAITYARRYALSAMLGVIADDDDDGNAASGVGGKAAPAPKPEPQKSFDPDPDGQVTAWCELRKKEIAAATRLPGLYQWQDENEAALDRLKRKSAELHKDLKAAYQARFVELSKKETK